MVDVPTTYPPGVKLFDVEGVPVSVGKIPGVEGLNLAWDFPEPRLFPMDSVLRNGTRLSGTSSSHAAQIAFVVANP